MMDIDLDNLTVDELLELQTRVESAIQFGWKPVGDVNTSSFKWFSTHCNTEYDLPDDEDDMNKACEAIFDERSDHKSVITNYNVHPLDDETVEKLLKEGTPSGYGDLKTGETKVDKTVRDAVCYKEHPLVKTVLIDHDVRSMFDEISDIFGKGKFKYQLKWLNVYGVGGHFKKHVDTPQASPNYRGTIVVEIPTVSGREGGDLVLQTEEGKTVHYREGNYSAMAFLPYIVHEVTPIAKGARVSISFDVFVEENLEPESKRFKAASKNQFIVEGIRDAAPDEFGLLLKNKYASKQHLYGIDSEVVKALSETHDVAVIPVRVKYDYSQYGEEDPEYSIDVSVRAKDYKDGWTGLNFYALGKASMMPRDINYQQGAEYTGNEALPCTEDMKYYSMGAICTRKSTH